MMRVTLILEHRFAQSPDGAVWTHTTYPYDFWRRYLCTFDAVNIIARTSKVETACTTWHRVDGPSVHFTNLPDYVGPVGFLRRLPQLRRTLLSSIAFDDAVILRLPSPIATTIQPSLLRRNRPYTVEVVADPFDVFAPGAVTHPLRPIFRRWFSQSLKRQCRLAAAAAYVTQDALQRRYPIRPGEVSASYSDVDLPDTAFTEVPRAARVCNGEPRLVTVGSLAQAYKGVDVLLNAVAVCHKRGESPAVTVVGDGKHRPELEQQTAALGLTDAVRFLGTISSGKPVREELDRADIFVLPSRTEGLPRALLEAMARGLPCLASAVGGIPELLTPNDMVPAGDASALAEKITEVASDPVRRSQMSTRNFCTAREYHNEALEARRRRFYDHVRRITEQYLGRRPAGENRRAADACAVTDGPAV